MIKARRDGFAFFAFNTSIKSNVIAQNIKMFAYSFFTPSQT